MLGSGPSKGNHCEVPGPHPLSRKDTILKKRIALAGAIVGLIGGGAIGFAVGLPQVSGAQTPSVDATTSTSAPTGPSDSRTTPSGGFKSNENATHETGEDPARETAENNGTFHPGGGVGHPNEDPTHEASEGAAREGAETAGQAPASNSTATSTNA